MQIRHEPGQRRSTSADKAEMPHSIGVFSISNDLPQDGGCLGISEVEGQEQGLFHDGQVGPRQQTGKDVLPALGAGDVLAPRSASWVPIKRSKQAASSADLSNETTAARPAVGSASTVRRATNRRTIGIWQTAASTHGPSLIGRDKRFDSVPDHQGKHRVRGVFLVARQRFGDRPAIC